MNNKILNQLTFGFEIEGRFSEDIYRKLSTDNWKDDGSVHGVNYNKSCVSYSEYNSPVFTDFDAMIKKMELFNSDDHFFNDTCGLHLHIGIQEQAAKPKIIFHEEYPVGHPHREQVIETTENWKKLWQSAQSWELQRNLHRQALQYCPDQHKRLTGIREDGREANYFCKLYKNKEYMVAATKKFQNIKYSFMNFHARANTLEFRFFSPCEHKVENVKKLVSSLTDFLGKESHEKRLAMAEYQPVSNKQELVKRTLPIANHIEITKSIFSFESIMNYHSIVKDSVRRFLGHLFTGKTRELKPWEIGLLPSDFRLSSVGTQWSPRWDDRYRKVKDKHNEHQQATAYITMSPNSEFSGSYSQAFERTFR